MRAVTNLNDEKFWENYVPLLLSTKTSITFFNSRSNVNVITKQIINNECNNNLLNDIKGWLTSAIIIRSSFFPIICHDR